MKNDKRVTPERYQELRNKLLSGEITALTFDTQVFDRNGRTFKGGLLGELDQLKQSNIQILFTEVVRDEVENHILERHRAKALRAEEALSKLSGSLSASLAKKVSRELDSVATPETMTFIELNDFFLKTGAEMISYEEVPARALFEHYFANRAPFHKTNNKKSEFPDAMALLCLEEHSKTQGILVISEDEDWVSFCKESKTQKLHHLPDLISAFDLINSAKDEIKSVADSKFRRFVEFEQSGELLAIIEKNVVDQLHQGIEFSGKSDLDFTASCLSISILNIEHEEEHTFGTIRHDASVTVWALEKNLKVQIRAEVEFTSMNDTYMGTSIYSQLISIPATSIIRMTNDTTTVNTMFKTGIVLNLGKIRPGENL
ncbi:MULTISPECIES: PIN domain-containing protein [unclassified Pseudomonas]|uniref:PIN domain-containing protein n=1 Tax=unclassified Pseudomonas TaxID=196821 RepID=UPI000D3820C8|nr:MULTISPECIES: PIN domain-containing protein [unclassified Pseudomonas]RAU46582.1 hypothetical protein DBP26_010470 [Pseudomonas sp. RIT 409]RAU52405.1 hypothetical protein DBY65_017380 [Pseudomonas sp. RIT 412]